MSKALLKPTCSKTVRSGCFFLQKPLEIFWLKSCKALLCCADSWNACWMSGTWRCSSRVRRMSRSMIFMAGQSSETGRYDVDSSAGLPAFSRGIIREDFHIDGIWLCFRERLNLFVRNPRATGPRCFKWRVDIHQVLMPWMLWPSWLPSQFLLRWKPEALLFYSSWVDVWLLSTPWSSCAPLLRNIAC